MQRPEPLDPAVHEIVLSLPGHDLRHCVRAISVQVRDVPGVVAVEADLTTRTVRVQGTSLPDALLAVMADAGYDPVEAGSSAARVEVSSHDRQPPHLPEWNASSGAGGTSGHAHRLHLILVSRDLGVFRHMHPSLGGDGVWRVGLDPLPPGPYRAFADFAAVGGPELTLGRDVTVSGEHVPRPLPAASPTADVDDYQVELSGTPTAAGEGEVTLTVRRGGQAVADLEPYLGALGHLVAIRASDLAYLHVHPLDGRAGTGRVPFAVEAPSAGTYGLFFDFSHQGTVRTAAFTIEVPAVNAGTPTTSAHRGGH